MIDVAADIVRLSMGLMSYCASMAISPHVSNTAAISFYKATLLHTTACLKLICAAFPSSVPMTFHASARGWRDLPITFHGIRSSEFELGACGMQDIAAAL